MLGAIIGDICGSIYESHNQVTAEPETINLIREQCFFTDDSVLTMAVANKILGGYGDYGESILQWARSCPRAGYGGEFRRWFHSENPQPYNSFGNGSAMRVSPVGWAFSSLDETLAEAEQSAACTHNHPEGVKGAQATAAAIWLARHGQSKAEIRRFITANFAYDLERSCDSIRPDYRFDVTCQGTVPEAIIAFLESKDFTQAIQLAISLGGDSDTLACITGGIAEAFYGGVPQDLQEFAWQKIAAGERWHRRPPGEMRHIVGSFRARFL
ncbi:MAG: ADP-ribosylglycohydrolase family protein [Desulfobulbaceae bacterium]|jgi:ADP-ribosylglycohydrolase|nr:ADP-ribosylglycohydrolase family protein [Desulfobulbaceae bacterium]